jgi:hypothetical protein
MSDRDRGLYGKYYVERLEDHSGKHARCQYYVLDPTHDKFAIPALQAYADACEEEYPLLARDIRKLIGE